MKTKRNARLCGATMVAAFFVAASIHAQPFGQWDFDGGNLAATVGSALTYADGPGGATDLADAFSSTTGFGIPNIGGNPAAVLKYPAATNGMGYMMPTPAANGRGSFVDNYTLLLDVLFPAESEGRLRPIIETDGGFIVPGADLGVSAANGLGIVGGTSFGSITTNTWYRIGFVVRTNEARMFINGALVGSQSVSGAEADRLVLSPSDKSLILANTAVNPAAPGYVNSIQIRAEALGDRHMQAMGGPSATGIPQTVPPIPSFINNWIPSSAFANRNSDIGVVIDDGDTTILDSSITLKLDNVTLANAAITRAGDLITVKTNLGNLSLGQHKIVVSYTDSAIGAQSYTNTFAAVLFYEDFDGLTLGPNVNEGMPTVYPNVWTTNPPAGWTVDRTTMPGYGDDAADGMTEWVGWSFASKDFWSVVTDDQGRQQFTNSRKVVAVADPDEWDDQNHAVGYFNSSMKTPPIPIGGLSANTIFLKFDSSWDYEAFDDCGGTKWPDCPATNNQTAIITVSYNGGAEVQVLKWDSDGGANGTYNPSPAVSPTFHDTAYNENVTLLLNNPANATNVVIKFALLNAGNDWWWAIDNIQVSAGPAITTQPVSITRDAGSSASFSVIAQGSGTLSYQWQFNGGSGSVYTNLPGETGGALTFTAETNNTGSYRVLVTDSISTTPSSAATLTVIAAPKILLHPTSLSVNAGVGAGFSVAARGRSPISYQWTKNSSPISGETTTRYTTGNAQLANAGQYACVIANADGAITSRVAYLEIVTNITQGLVAHLKFDSDYSDSSGRGNNGTPIGTTALVPGKIGNCLQYTEPYKQPETNYVTLGKPADLHMGDSTSFSISFWYKVNPGDRVGDPAIVANKDWDSGSNLGFVLFNSGSGLRWNYRELDAGTELNTRKDSGATSPGLEDGNWHHCVVVFNRLGNAGTYVDGNLVHVGALATAAPAAIGGFYAPTTIDTDPPTNRVATATGAWNIGEDSSGWYGLHDSVGVTNAMIDDLGIWRRALTPGEVQAIYVAGNTGNSLETASPVANPRPLDPASISLSGTNVVVNKGNTMLLSAPSVTGPWTEATAARGTNQFVEPATSQKFYRGSQP